MRSGAGRAAAADADAGESFQSQRGPAAGAARAVGGEGMLAAMDAQVSGQRKRQSGQRHGRAAAGRAGAAGGRGADAASADAGESGLSRRRAAASMSAACSVLMAGLSA